MFPLLTVHRNVLRHLLAAALLGGALRVARSGMQPALPPAPRWALSQPLVAALLRWLRGALIKWPRLQRVLTPRNIAAASLAALAVRISLAHPTSVKRRALQRRLELSGSYAVSRRVRSTLSWTVLKPHAAQEFVAISSQLQQLNGRSIADSAELKVRASPMRPLHYAQRLCQRPLFPLSCWRRCRRKGSPCRPSPPRPTHAMTRLAYQSSALGSAACKR